jgi:hypothetical protein
MLLIYHYISKPRHLNQTLHSQAISAHVRSLSSFLKQEFKASWSSRMTHHHPMALQPISDTSLPLLGFITITFLQGLEDQASVFMAPRDRVAQLYPQALSTHFSRLLRHARVTVGLFFNPGHHTGQHDDYWA